MIELKNQKEIDKMRRAGAISAGALRIAKEALKVGTTTAAIDRAVRQYIESQGARPSFLNYDGFPASACISINEEIIHGIPGDRIIREGDIVSVDVGAVWGGYNGDNAATFGVGRISPEAQRLLDVTEKALELGIAAAVSGNRLGDIGFAIQSYVESNGCSVVKEYIGHGVGRDLHEEPEVPNYGRAGHGARLVPGMTIAIEPMVNLGTDACRRCANGWTVVTADGKLSAHFENSVAITGGARPLILTAE